MESLRRHGQFPSEGGAVPGDMSRVVDGLTGVVRELAGIDDAE